MAKKQFYPAIIDDELIGIFQTWEECKPYVTGIKGHDIQFAGFKTRKEALRFIIEKTGWDVLLLRVTLEEQHIPYEESDFSFSSNNAFTNDKKENKKEEILPYFPKDVLHIYTDGSFSESQNKYSYGLYAVKNNEKVYEENGAYNDPEAAKLYQVAGEILGAEKAILYALSKGEKEVVLFYDYQGVEAWVKEKQDGGWQANNEFTKRYQTVMREYQKQITIYFVKIKSHVPKAKRTFHHKCNEKADFLAKQALGLVSKEGFHG